MLKQGQFVRSLAGKDKGNVSIIIRNDAEAVWVADGKKHTVKQPKRKNEKHIQPLEITNEELAEKITSGTVKDEEIKYALKQYRKSGVE